MKKIFSVVTGVLSGLFLLAFVVVCTVNYASYIHSINFLPYDFAIAIYAALLLVPSAVLGTASLVRVGKVRPLYIAAIVFALMTIPAWVNIAAMDFISGLPMLICISCVLCGALMTKFRSKPLFICAGAVFAAFLAIALIAAAAAPGKMEGEQLLAICAVFVIPAIDGAAFGLAGGWYLLGKPIALFSLAGVLIFLTIPPFNWGAVGFVYAVPTILCAAVCIALGILSKRDRRADTNSKETYRH